MLRNGFLIGLLWLSGLASLQAAVYELPKRGQPPSRADALS